MLPIKRIGNIKKKKQSTSFLADPNIGVIDLETYTVSIIQKGRVYSGGLYSVVNDKPVTFNIDKSTMDNNKIIYDLLDEMFKNKYKDIIWYCHNFGKFDSVFILSAIQKYNNDPDNNNKYELSSI